MSSNTTISPPEALALSRCLISRRDLHITRPQSNVLSQEFPEVGVADCLNSAGLQESVLDNLLQESLLSRDQFRYCQVCDHAAEICSNDSHSYDTKTVYRIQPTNLIEEWVDWVESGTDLVIEDCISRSNSHWQIEAQLDSDQVIFQVFFSARKLREYDFEPETSEFGIGFYDASYLDDEEYIFSWIEPLEETRQRSDSFNTRLRGAIEMYENPYSSRLVDEEISQGFHRDVRGGIWDYLDNNGYNPEREIERYISSHRRKYNINPQGDDFVAVSENNDNEVILACRCSVGTGSYHFHRFVDEKIQPAEDDDRIRHLAAQMNDLIDEYLEIQRQKNNMNRTANLLVLVSTIASVSLVADAWFNIYNVLGEYLPSGFTIPPLLKILLLIGNFVVVLVLGTVLLHPYVKQIRFSWSISPSDNNTDGLLTRLRN